MKSVKGKALRGKLIILTLFFIFFLFPSRFTVYPTYATDSTPSADIKAKLEELKKEIASKAAKLKLEITNKLQNKAYVGKVKTKSDTTITLATKNGSRIINITQDADFESKVKALPAGRQGKKFSQKTIAEEDYLATLGDVDENGVMTAKRIILLPQPKAGQPLADKTYLWGQVVGISGRLATLKDKASKSVAVSIASPFSVRVGDFVILTGNLGKNDIFEAGFVYVSKKAVYPAPNGAGATPSAQTATPSSKKK